MITQSHSHLQQSLPSVDFITGDKAMRTRPPQFIPQDCKKRQLSATQRRILMVVVLLRQSLNWLKMSFTLLQISLVRHPEHAMTLIHNLRRIILA